MKKRLRRSQIAWLPSLSPFGKQTLPQICPHSRSHITRPLEDEDDDENEDDIPSGLCDFVYQFPKRGGGDFYDVTGQQSKIVWGDDTGAG